MKTCTKCHTPKALKDFYAKPTGRLGVAAECKACTVERMHARYAAKGAEIRAKSRIKNATPEMRQYELARTLAKAGLTPEQYEQALIDQNGVCKICKQPPTKANKQTSRLHADHDHETGAFRGLLCTKHNTGLGLFEDSPELLLAAVAYLREAASTDGKE
jgi:Recombination endonuclease VII